jgi:lipid A 3-O-deacylase
MNLLLAQSPGALAELPGRPLQSATFPCRTISSHFLRETIMTQTRHAHAPLRTTLLAAALGALATVAGNAQAEDKSMQVVLKYGQDGGDYERAGVGLRFAPLWSYQGDNWKAKLYPEAEYNHFHYSGSRHGTRDDLDQIGGIAMMRFEYGSGTVKPFAEIGLGGALFDHTQLGDKNISTSFQFSEHLTLGVDVSNAWWVGAQYSHYSNAGIKEPNPGLDYVQFVVGAHF